MTAFFQSTAGSQPLTGVTSHWFTPYTTTNNGSTILFDAYTNTYNGNAPYNVTLTSIQVDAAGNPVGSPTPIASYATGYAFNYADAPLAFGGTALFWTSADGTYPASSLVNLNVQETDASGHPIGSAVTLLTGVNDVHQVHVSSRANGGTSYLVTYATFDPNTHLEQVQIQGFTADGVAISGENGVLDSYTTRGNYNGFGFGTVNTSTSANPSSIYLRGYGTSTSSGNVGIKYELIGTNGVATTSFQEITPSYPTGSTSQKLLDWTWDRLNPTTSSGYNLVTISRYSYVDSSNVTHEAIDVHTMNTSTQAANDDIIPVTSGSTGLTETHLPNGGFVIGYGNGSGAPNNIREYDANGNVVGGGSFALPSNETNFSLQAMPDGRLLVEYPSTANGGNQLNYDIYDLSNPTTLISTAAADALHGSTGVFDFVSYENAASGVLASLANPSTNTGAAAGDSYSSIEGLDGSNYGDTLVSASSGSSQLYGGGGDDALYGLGGHDYLNGGTGNDGLYSNGGSNTLDGGAGFDFARYDYATAGVSASLANPATNAGSAGGDSYSSIEGLIGSSYNDTLTSSNVGGNQLWGGGGNDTLFGLSGHNYINGGSDNDTIFSGGSNTIDGGAGIDFARYDYAGAGVVAALDPSASPYNTGAAAGDTYTGVEGLVGTAFNDVLFGDSGSNQLYGGAGNDRLVGGAGDDALFGGTGSNELQGGAGNDYFHFYNAELQAGVKNTIDDFSSVSGNTDHIDLTGVSSGNVHYVPLSTGTRMDITVAGGTASIFEANASVTHVENQTSFL